MNRECLQIGGVDGVRKVHRRPPAPYNQRVLAAKLGGAKLLPGGGSIRKILLAKDLRQQVNQGSGDDG
jgi:hypothetical protein